MFKTSTRHLSNAEMQRQLSGALNNHEVATRHLEEEYAAKWNAAKRQQAVKNGDALSDGSFPIVDQEDMNNAARLIGNSNHPKATVVAHMKKQAKKHGLKLPDSLS